ncbi:PadR family transcriptional regulator [Rhizohabitans arisaemae]|uniref:PadR family transcriptional regulator n=1 Tax=Rhizohabitans arisaemae TaxID=2720610 RepID=UPI0024B23780|nr:PadR family transcriptional regulator [Rhizohabitans arisaemae]
MELTPTAWAILGFLSLKAQSGYEILRAAKRSMEAFWGISNGQLYPQLRFLAEQGLIRPVGEAEGPRSRQRWEITEEGGAALRWWLESISSPVQIRDENLVKLFFAGQSGPDLVGRLLEERKKIFTQFESVIDAVLPGDRLPEAEQAAALGAPELLFRYGKHFTKSTMRWIDQEERRVLDALRKTAPQGGDSDVEPDAAQEASAAPGPPPDDRPDQTGGR